MKFIFNNKDRVILGIAGASLILGFLGFFLWSQARSEEMARDIQARANQWVSSDPFYLEKIPAEYRETCLEIKSQLGFSLQLIWSLVQVESGWNPQASGNNSNGTQDMGLCQLNSGNNWTGNPWNPADNLWMGFRYLKGLQDRFGTIEGALVAYNGGPGRYVRGESPAVSFAYAKKILGQ